MERWKRELIYGEGQRHEFAWRAYCDQLIEQGMEEYAIANQSGRCRCVITRIPKKSGGFRTIFMPTHWYAQRLKGLLHSLNGYAGRHISALHAVGFRRGYNVADAAIQHVGFAYTIGMDFSDFFDSVTREMIPDDLQRWVSVSECFFAGRTRQGLATSPILSNVACKGFDLQMESDLAKVVRGPFVYTRYADDIAISCNDAANWREVTAKVEELVNQHGFRINTKKTRLQSSRHGNRQILGVSVGAENVGASRKDRRRLKTLQYRAEQARRGEQVRGHNQNVVEGMTGWVNMLEAYRGGEQ